VNKQSPCLKPEFKIGELFLQKQLKDSFDSWFDALPD